MMDDSIVAGSYHFPCVIYMREGGEPVGKVHKDMRKDRIEYLKTHDTHNDPICKKNCIDACVELNNKIDKFKNERN